MGKEDKVIEGTEAVANGTDPQEKTCEDVTEKKVGKHDGPKEMEEDKKDNDKTAAEKMDEDPKGKECKDEKEKEAAGEGKVELTEEDNGTPNKKDEAKDKEEIKGAVDEKIDRSKDEEKKKDAKVEDTEEEKGSKKSVKGKRVQKTREKKKESEVKKEQEPKTPASDRPVRERKSVERLVATIEKESVKEFQIPKVVCLFLVFSFLFDFDLTTSSCTFTRLLIYSLLLQFQGRGTPLKDIPNGTRLLLLIHLAVLYCL